MVLTTHTTHQHPTLEKIRHFLGLDIVPMMDMDEDLAALLTRDKYQEVPEIAPDFSRTDSKLFDDVDIEFDQPEAKRPLIIFHED